jgi:hypothetical protein
MRYDIHVDDGQVKIWKKMVLAFSRYPNHTEGNCRRLGKMSRKPVLQARFHLENINLHHYRYNKRIDYGADCVL